MNKTLVTITRMTLILSGISLLFVWGLAVINTVILFILSRTEGYAELFEPDDTLLWAIWLVLSIAGLALVAYLLIFKADKWAKLIVGDKELPSAEGGSVVGDWVPLVYRLAATAAGLLILPVLVTWVNNLVRLLLYLRNVQGGHRFLQHVISIVFLLAAAVYLLAGAPHLVRFHIRKTRELLAGSDEGGEPTAQ